ncbi:hypothetical protein ZHAS_00001006 [Anopheles sinensis]|uniref:Fringe-like glycosyltransferase domain-containing protein n=1 Tax=Anopheles sinensis TaxID=74873 RepID=A0A084VAW6_ANOSI|nr:hypothetical protein ZHAS_00001006 [Anopheles sinensis]
MILGGGGEGGGVGGGAFEPSAGRGASGAVISKRDNSVVPSGLRDADASDNEVDSRGGNLVRRNRPRQELGPTADPPNRIPVPPAVTGTPKPPTTELDDLLISVKTTKSYHDTRLEMIIKTWYQLGKEQVGCAVFVFVHLFFPWGGKQRSVQNTTANILRLPFRPIILWSTYLISIPIPIDRLEREDTLCSSDKVST